MKKYIIIIAAITFGYCGYSQKNTTERVNITTKQLYISAQLELKIEVTAIPEEENLLLSEASNVFKPRFSTTEGEPFRATIAKTTNTTFTKNFREK